LRDFVRFWLKQDYFSPSTDKLIRDLVSVAQTGAWILRKKDTLRSGSNHRQNKPANRQAGCGTVSLLPEP